MSSIGDEARAFREHKRRIESEAGQMAAFFLMTGIDLAAALTLTGEEKKSVIRRVVRLLERERLKGARRHWSYDLNRHIALKRALERLCGNEPARKKRRSATPVRQRRRHESVAPKSGSLFRRGNDETRERS